MRCASCRSEVDAASGICHRCGTPLRPGEKAYPPGGFVKGATLLEDPLPQGASGLAPDRNRAGAGGTAGEPGAAAVRRRTELAPPPLPPAGAAQPAAARGARPRLAGWLVAFSLDPVGTDFRLHEGRNVLGADSEQCDITVRDAASSVSGKHAIVLVRQGRFQICDNDSTNGTRVNGVDIFGQGTVELKDRDRIRLGEVELLLVVI